MNYYNDYANEYFDSTINVNMSSNLEQFERYLLSGCRILDIGCGSGRDVKHFCDKGFKTEGIDQSEKLCELAEAFSKTIIHCGDVLRWKPEEKFDALWANASLLHLEMKEIKLFFSDIIKNLLKIGGYAYISMKSGIETGNDSKGRFFTNFTKTDLDEVIKENPNIELIDLWETTDEMNRNGFVWLNFIIRLN